MWGAFREVLKQPYRVVALLFGVVLLAGPCLTIDKNYAWNTHEPTTLWPVLGGVALIALSAVGFFIELWRTRSENVGAGVDLSRVKESKGTFSTNVARCEIRVANGRLEDYAKDPYTAVVLSCNEYFDDKCVDDTRSALGAYVNSIFQGQVRQFVALMMDECRKRLGPGSHEQKTEDETGVSHGVARCVILLQPLGRKVTVALLSTTTQRAAHAPFSRFIFVRRDAGLG